MLRKRLYGFFVFIFTTIVIFAFTYLYRIIWGVYDIEVSSNYYWDTVPLFIAAVIILLFFVIGAIEIEILRRLNRINKEIQHISINDTKRRLVHLDRDEIDSLCEDINKMLDTKDHALEEMKDIKNKYYRLVESIPAMVIEFYPNGNIIFANQSFYNFFNVDSGSSAQNVFELINGNKGVLLRSIRKLDSINPTDTFLQKLYLPSNTYLYVEWITNAISNSNGIVEKYQIIGWDVTHFKALEEEALRTEDRYSKIINNMQDTVFSLDKKGMVTYVSKQITKYFGYEEEEVIGRSFAEFIHPSDLPQISKCFQNPESSEKTLYTRVFDRDDNVHSVKIKSNYLKEGEKHVGIIGVMIDLGGEENGIRSRVINTNI